VSRWLVITGYMGAGKTSVGRRVASRLGRTFVDADREIEAHAGMPIPEIFSRRGEVWFRRTEETVIREILAREPGVLALGGGALESDRTRGLVSRTADVVWLKASVAVAWARVEGSDRPLAADRGRFERRARAREANYRAAAHLEVDADAPADVVAGRVAAWAGGRETPAPAETPR
jgi:shikimate kinase